MPLTLPEQARALDIARAMTKVGIPIFVAPPALNRQGVWLPKGGTGNCGYVLPPSWQATMPDPRIVDTWRPGMALCAVGGTAADFLDNDPRNGGEVSEAALSAAGQWPHSYGRQATPSGGVHDIIAPLRVGSRDAFAQGLDLKGGTPPDDAGKTHRGFIFLAPTVKISKVNGTPRTYRWLAEPDLLRLIAAGPSDHSGAHIAVLARKSNSTPSQPGPGADPFFVNSHGDVREFTREQAQQFCAPYLDALYNAQIGNIYDSLNKAALVLGHFGSDFWPYETTMQWLWTALGNTAYNGATWQADKTIDKALADGARTWQATLVEPRPFVERPVEDDQERGKKGKPRRLPLIPGHVWERRSWLRAIRDRAHETTAVPDATLGAALSIYAASVDHQIKIRTGIKDDLGLSLLIGVVGGSGLGKSTGWKLARRDFAPLDAPRPKPTPTGEGLAEALMGWTEHTEPSTGKTFKKHEQVRHNALFTIGEGAAMNVTMERSGATLGPTLRQVFSDEDLGTTTASEERHRDVPGGSYTMGVVVLYQETTAMKIINDTDTGTAQRFLWFAGHSPSAPPSGLIQAPRMVSPNVTTLPREQRIDGSENYVLAVEPAITEKLRAEDAEKRDAYSLGDANRDSQKPAVVAKVAALACLIEGRTLVTADDWSLAEEIYASSRAVQDELIELAEEQDRAKRREVAAKAGEADHVRKSFRAVVKVVAEVITRKARKLGRPITKREITQSVTPKKRAYISEALDMAVHENGWLVEKDGKFDLGSVPLLDN